jgi:hypothetical protein
MGCLRTCKISVEVLQPERKLVAINPFRPSAELRPLQPLDDEPKPLNLDLCLRKLRLVSRHLCSQIAHQPVQRIDIGGQGGEVDVHA